MNKILLMIGLMSLMGLSACSSMYTSVNGSNSGFSGAVGTSLRW